MSDNACLNCTSSLYERHLTARTNKKARFCSLTCQNVYNHYEYMINVARRNLVKPIIINEQTFEIQERVR